MSIIEHYTLVQIESLQGIIYHEDLGKNSLSRWYETIRVKKLSELTEDDVIRLARQNLYLSYIVPRAFKILRNNRFAGKQYDGELLVVLSRIFPDFWDNHGSLKEELLTLVHQIASEPTILNNHEWASTEDKRNFENTLNKIISELI